MPRPSHTTVAVPNGVRAPRFRAATTSAESVDLNGTWQFRLCDTADTGLDPRDDGIGWDAISVPGHWQLAEAPDNWPYGKPAYTNTMMPIAMDPPNVPRENPTGEYRRTVDVPASWLYSGRVVLRFEGVDSWFETSVNGISVATSHGSRLPTEIDITEHVQAGANLLAVRVTQWSAFTYIEDQDQWWLSGIFRDVVLLHRPNGGIEHVSITAEYDHLSNEGIFCAEVETSDGAIAAIAVPELGIEVGAGEQTRTPVEPWSAESPRLYEATVRTESETVTLQVGFRTIDTADGVLRVNGRPVKLYGVNRHEFEPTRGRAVTAETMLADVLLAKKHHVNAVRTSHYPPHPHFLDLCDRYGLYVMDENDMESHGFHHVGWRGNPTDLPEWRDVLVDRVERTVRRDAHHASVIMWSLGNESGKGRNIAEMAAAIRELDPSRPIHYEGDFSSEHVDVYSRMYAGVDEVARIGRGEDRAIDPYTTTLEIDGRINTRRLTLPFIQCEYAHAMGNGPGGLLDYDELFQAYPRLAGGFIWEWIDHGIATRDEHGTLYHGYGGDFAEELHDGTFIADGLLLPDRSPSPGLVEMAAVYAPIRITEAAGSLEIRNRYAFRSSEHVDLRWELHADGHVLADGDLSEVVGVLQPGESASVAPAAVGVDLSHTPQDADVWWTVRAINKQEGEHEPVELGAGQLLVRERAPLAPLSGSVRRIATGYSVGPATFDDAGRLTSIGGTAVSTSRADAWRAPTENDLRTSWLGGNDSAEWELAGLSRLHERLDQVEIVSDDKGESLVVAARLAGAATDCGFAVRYHWRADQKDASAVELRLELGPEGNWAGSVARLGWLLALEQPDAANVRVNWTGQGPGESYSDSTMAVLHGQYQHTVAELQTNYTFPQENGARRGVTRAVLELANGPLEVLAGEVKVAGRERHGFELTARPWSDQALSSAAHPHELEPDGLLWLHLDAAQQGLGSAACGPGVLPNATLAPAPATLQVRLRIGASGGE